MKNVVIFASDAKHASYLNSIINKGWNDPTLNIFYMICNDTLIRDPRLQFSAYYTNHNIKDKNKIISHLSNTLNINLPFKPDWLILSRERWYPEENIILEFKQKWNTKVALVEPNSAFINSINQFLESESKNRFVKNIDVWFDHSKFIQTQRKLLNFKGNSVVVGNPKYDQNLDVNKQDLDTLKKHYNIDPNKKQVIFYTFINKFRYKLFDEFKKFKENHPEYQYFVKPYPKEPFENLKNEYFPKFIIEGVTPILEETHIWGMYNLCDIHVGAISSVMYPSYFLNKEIIDFSLQIGYFENLEINQDMINNAGGDEEQLDLWKRVFNISKEEFKQMTSKEKILPMLKNNKDIIRFLSDIKLHHKDILKMYDEFNDNQASKRIINYIKNEK
jgi:hypothetical protein|tara:strand:+ start:511 stop:1677 length:1167 start_codon:yes stop_codon:yes gene_type:complete